MQATITQAGPSALVTRLSRLAPLGDADYRAIALAERDQRRWPARREILGEGEPIRERRAIVSGWACRQRILADGQRQIISFLLPGDLIGMCRHRNPVASTSILAVSEVVTCTVPDAPSEDGPLAQAYALSSAMEQHYLLAQITRLGRLSALERLADWILEIQERLAFADLSEGDQLPVPLTQEFLADTLGLTSVHVNRTLNTMRRDGLLTSRGGTIVLADRDRLEKMVGYQRARVTTG
ncbi:MAG TPA: Crp/Fnr family transcriptional regulator [Sphingomonas sp.]|nr:Crp/Fnr family transcriptional regulator [Sphingomonas sp.]